MKSIILAILIITTTNAFATSYTCTGYCIRTGRGGTPFQPLTLVTTSSTAWGRGESKEAALNGLRQNCIQYGFTKAVDDFELTSYSSYMTCVDDVLKSYSNLTSKNCKLN